MIYFEAFANALDAHATEFNIDISLSDYGEWHNLVLTISDNGVGFDDIRFEKFSKLFDFKFMLVFEKIIIAHIVDSVNKIIMLAIIIFIGFFLVLFS